MKVRYTALALVFFAASGCKKKEEPVVAAQKTAPLEKPTTVAPKQAGRELVDMGEGSAGINVDPTKAASQPAITDSNEASPVVIWNERGTIYVKRWKNAALEFDGKGTFLGLGGPLNHDQTRAAGSKPRIALEDPETPIAAWIELNSDDKPELKVSRFVAGQWSSLGSASTTPKDSGPFVFDLAASSEGPVVAFGERIWKDATNKLLVRRWDGSSWQPLGAEKDIALSADHEVQEVLVASTAKQAPIVIWRERKSGQPPVVMVRRWEGKGWVKLDSPAGVDGDSSIRASAAADGSTYLWMSKNVGFTPIQRLAAGAKSWTDLGSPAITGAPYGEFAIGGGVATQATDRGILVWAYKNEWQLIGQRPLKDRANIGAIAGSPGHTTFVVWQDVSSEPHQVRVSAALREEPAHGEPPF